ncbi:MAG: hypothetical protein RIA63_07810, partial [Cyclobacteriaceae bacterium]
GENTTQGVPIHEIDQPQSTGDPWVAPNGSYLIFTKYDFRNWDQTCDLYISFRHGSKWSEPIELKELNSEGPDFGVAISPDEEWVYYRRSYQFIKVQFKELLEKYQGKS